MARTRERTGRGDGPLLENWRHEKATGARARVFLLFRRGIVTVVSLGLIATLLYFLIRPLLQPKTYFLPVFAEARVADGKSIESINNLSLPPIRYFFEDVADMVRVPEVFAKWKGSGNGSQSVPTGADQITRQLAALQDVTIHDRDTLVVYIVAHGVVIPGSQDGSEARSNSSEGAPYLISSDCLLAQIGDLERKKLNAEAAGFCNVANMLKLIDGLPGATKLVLLDAGRREALAGQPYEQGDFDAALRSVVEKIGSPSLYVVTANGKEEYSHVSPELEQSVFGYEVSRAMARNASNSYGKTVNVEQFFAVVESGVEDSVKKATNDYEKQSPQLIAASAASQRNSNAHLFFTSSLPVDTPETVARRKDKKSGGALESFRVFLEQRAAGLGYHEQGRIWLKRAGLAGSQSNTSGEAVNDGEPKPTTAKSYESDRQERERTLAICWESTALLEKNRRPHEYAPLLWRLHLDRLVWLDQLQHSGDLPTDLENALGNSLAKISKTLSFLNDQPEFTPYSKLPNQVDSVLKQVIALRDQTNISIAWDEVPTLALARMANGAEAMPPAVRDLSDRFKEWSEQSGSAYDWARFDEIRGKLEPSQQRVVERYYEVQLLDEFRGLVPDRILRLAIQARRIGEQVSADLLAGQGWGANDIEAGDWLRIEAEHLLADRAMRDWESRAEANLRGAIDHYDDAAAEIDKVRNAKRLAKLISLHLRDIAILSSLKVHVSSELLENLEEVATLSPQTSTDSKQQMGESTARIDEFQRMLADTVPELSDLRTWRMIDLPAARKALRDHGSQGSMAYQIQPVPSLSTDSIELTGSGDRNAKLRELRERFYQLYFASPQDAMNVVQSLQSGNEVPSIQKRLREAEWYDLLNRQSARFDRGLQYVSQSERARLQRQIGICDSALASLKLPGNPELVVEAPPTIGLRLDGQSTDQPLDISGSSARAVNFAVGNNANTAQKVWIVAQYDESLIQVEASGWPLYHEHLLLEGANVGQDGNSLRREATKNSQSLELDAFDRTHPLTLRIRRNGEAATGNASLVLKLISERDAVRDVLPLGLPTDKQLRLLIADGASNPLEITEVKDEHFLFANRSQDITLYVSNIGDKSRSLTVNVYAPQEDLDSIDIPSGLLRADAARRLFGRMPPPIALAAKLVNLNPNQQQEVEFDFESESNIAILGQAPENPAAGPHKERLPYGILVEVIDDDDESRMYRWIKFEAWRPKSFLTATEVIEDTINGARVRITLTKNSLAQAIPDGQVEATIEVGADFVLADEGQFSVPLRAPDFSGELSIVLNGLRPSNISNDVDAEDFVRVSVDIDGYPRAFEYTVEGTNLTRIKDELEVRIVKPLPGSEFESGTPIPATFEITAPDAFFMGRDVNDRRINSIALGIDGNDDRDLDDAIDTRQVVYSDRFMQVFVSLPNGRGRTLSLRPEVSEWNVTLNSEGKERKVNVLASILGGAIADEEPRPVAIDIDGKPPEFKITPLIEYKDGTLIVKAQPTDQIEITEVLATLDQYGRADSKWEKGEEGAQGVWRIELNASELKPGEQRVRIKAKDKLGHWTDPPIAEDWIKPADEIPVVVDGGGNDGNTGGGMEKQDPKPVKNRVSGKLVYNNVPVRDIVVTLIGPGAPTGKAKDLGEGRFDFGDIPAGTYTLEASGMGGGSTRRATEEVKVSDQPGRPVTLNVKIR